MVMRIPMRIGFGAFPAMDNFLKVSLENGEKGLN
jgi:hypothetical protein